MSEASEKIQKRAEELVEIFGTATVVTVGGVKLCDFGHLRALLAERTQDAADATRYRWLASRMSVSTDSDGSVMDWWLELQWLGTMKRDAGLPNPPVAEVIDEMMRTLPPPPEAPQPQELPPPRLPPREEP